MYYKNKIDEDGFYQSASTDLFNRQLTDEFYLFLNLIDNDKVIEISKNHIEDFLWFYKKGADIAILSYNGNDFLHLLADDIYAPIDDVYKVTNAFRSVGASLENISSSGDTPLSKAVLLGNKKMVRELVQLGADVKARNSHFKPLEMAIYNGDIDIAYLLSADLKLTSTQKESLVYDSDFFNNIELSAYVKEDIFKFIRRIDLEMADLYVSRSDTLVKEYLEKTVPLFKNKDKLANLSFEAKLTILKDNMAVAEKNGFSKNPQTKSNSLNVLDKLLNNIDLRLLDFFVAQGVDLGVGFSLDWSGVSNRMNALQKSIALSDFNTVEHIIKNDIQKLNSSIKLWNSFKKFNVKTIEIYELLKVIQPKSVNNIENDGCFISSLMLQGDRSFTEYNDFINRVLDDSSLKNKPTDFKVDFSWENNGKSENVLSLFLKYKNLFITCSQSETNKFCKTFGKLLKTNTIKSNTSFEQLCANSSTLNISVLNEIKKHYGHFNIKKSPELEVIMTNLILKNRNMSDDEYKFILNNVDGLTKPMCMHMIYEIFKVNNKSFDDMLTDNELDGFIKKHGVDFNCNIKNEYDNQLIVALLGYSDYLKCIMIRYDLDVSKVVNSSNLNNWQQKQVQELILDVERIHLSNDSSSILTKKKNNFKV